MSDAHEAEAPKARRYEGRSPNYPFFDLERSLARSAQLYESEKLHATPVAAALRHWGYSNPGGKAAMTLSSLKQFGLLEDIGRGEGRRVKLTTLAYDILNTPHATERDSLVRNAALLPEVHREMWAQYGSALPSDSSLEWTLTKDWRFTHAGAQDFLRQWKRTMVYAGLNAEVSTNVDPERTSAEADDQIAHGYGAAISTAPSVPSLTRVERSEPGPAGESVLPRLVTGRSSAAVSGQQFPIPLPGGAGVITLGGDFPLRESDWVYFMSVLAAMKPGLVEAASDGFA